MRKTAIAVLAFILLLTAGGAAQAAPQVTAAPETVYVNAEGKFESAPDTAVIHFVIGAQAETQEAAYARASKAAVMMRQVLQSEGIDPKTAQVGSYSLNPVFDWRSPKRKIVGYRVGTSVMLKLKDFKKVGPLSQKLAEIPDTDNQSLSYELDNIEAAKAKAVEDAYRRARATAETLVKAAGRTLGALTYASVDAMEPVHIPMMQTMRAKTEMAAADAAPMEGFSEQKITVTARVTAMFKLQ